MTNIAAAKTQDIAARMTRTLEKKFEHGLTAAQREIIEHLDPESPARRIAVSWPRGAGKTSFEGAILYAVLKIPELRRRGGMTTIIASSFDQAAIAGRDCLNLLGSEAESRQTYQIYDQQSRFQIVHRPSGQGIQVRSSDPNRLQGLRPWPYFWIDEPASLWPLPHANRVFQSGSTSLGKAAGSMFIACGTAPHRPDHPFSRFLRTADYVNYTHGDRNQPLTEEHIASAYPSWGHPGFEALMAEVRREAQMAEKDSNLRREFDSDRLNLGAASTGGREFLCDIPTYQEIAVDAVPDPSKDYVLGLDISGSASMSAAAAVDPSGTIDYRVAFPNVFGDNEGKLALADRGQKDAAGDAYVQMLDDGDLWLCGERVVDTAAFVTRLIDLWGIPRVVIGDEFRRGEVLEALDRLGLGDRLVTQKMGWAVTEYISLFRRECVAQRLQIRDSFCARHAFGAAEIAIGPTGNMRMIKSATARDDLPVAICLGVGESVKLARPAPSLSYAGHGLL